MKKGKRNRSIDQMAFKALTISKEKISYSKKDFHYMKDLGTKITP